MFTEQSSNVDLPNREAMIQMCDLTNKWEILTRNPFWIPKLKLGKLSQLEFVANDAHKIEYHRLVKVDWPIDKRNTKDSKEQY